MRMNSLKLFSGLTAILACLSACNTSNEGPSTQEKKTSDSTAALAASDLNGAVARMSNLSQYQYGKEDLTQLRNSREEFAATVRVNPGNGKAQLGMALTGVMLAAQSNRLSSVINQSLDAKSPFDTRVTNTAPAMRLAVLQKVAAAAQFPEFHAIQDAIADTLLPALEDAITHLQVAYNDPAFSMTLTIEDKPRELDHAEAGVLLAGVHAIHGLLTLWLAYDYDLDANGSYDYLQSLQDVGTIHDFSQLTADQRAAFNQLTTLLGPGSPFLAVKPAWQTKLAGVDDEINSALGILKESVGSLKVRSNPAELLHLCAPREMTQCIESAELDQAITVIDSGIKYMNHPYQLAVPGLDTTVSIDFSAYFRVQDYKKMLPYYGFYNANDWSDAKPVLYFTDRNGKVTGNIKDLIDIGKRADSLGLPPAEVITEIRSILHLQDPTFQGFLPGATEDAVWSLLQKSMEKKPTAAKRVMGMDSGSSTETGPLVKRAASSGTSVVSVMSVMSPHFALTLLGRR